MAAYQHLDLSIYSDKVLGTQDGDVDKLLKLYNVSRDALDTMMKSIRDWYEKQPHLPQGQLHDKMILGQLITRAFSVEQSKENIDGYFGARHKMPELLCGLDPMPNNIKQYLLQGSVLVSPIRTKENHRLVICRMINSEDYILTDICKLGFLLRDYRLFNETASGEHWVIDVTNASLANILQMTPTLISKTLYHATCCYAPKLKGIHFVNMPSYGNTVIAVFKKILKPKHVSRLHAHTSFESVFDMLSREAFPKDLGGTADITCEEIGKDIYNALQSEPWKEFIKHMDKHFYTNESLRSTPAKEYNDRFGVDGSFRKLELD